MHYCPNINLELDELDITSTESKDYVPKHIGIKARRLYIAQVKQRHGIIELECYNAPKAEGGGVPQYPEDKVAAIEGALRHFGMI